MQIANEDNKFPTMNILIIGQGERGGTDYILKNLASWLKKNNHCVYFNENLDSIKKQKYHLVVLPTSRMHLIPILSRKTNNFQSSKFIIWCMGSTSFHDAYYNGRKLKNYPSIIMKILDMLIDSTSKSLFKENSLIFTDEVGMNSDLPYQRNKAFSQNNIIFPIPVKIDSTVTKTRISQTIKSVAWIGRIDSDFKILPLIQLIEDIAANKENIYFEKNIEFTIIGDGNAMPQLMECISKFKEIHFELHEWLDHKELNAVLLKRIDVLFAMGSSSLIGSSLGIPTVIVQPYSQITERQLENYRWIDETIGHSLGEFPGVYCEPKQVTKKFDELFINLNLQEKSGLSKKFSEKFNENLVFERFSKRNLPKDISYKTRFLLNILQMIRFIKYFIKSTNRNLR